MSSTAATRVSVDARPVWRSSMYRHEQLVAVYSVVFVLSVLFTVQSPQASDLSALVYPGIGVFTVWSQLLVARRTVDRRTRAAWWMLAFSSACIWGAGTLWTFWPGLAGLNAQTVLAQWIGGVYVPFAALGFMLFPTGRDVSFREPRVQVEAALLLVGSLALSWHFGMRPTLTLIDGTQQSDLGITGGYYVLIGECAVSLAASLAFVRASTRRVRTAIGLAFAGHLVYVLSDFFWTIAQTTYVPGHWVDLIFFVAWLLRWSSARYALHQLRRTPERAAAEPTRHSGGLGPSIFVVGAYALLLLALAVDATRSAIDIALVVTAMTFLLLVRQRLALANTTAMAHDTAAQAARFRSLIALAADFVVATDDRWHVTYVSPSAERVLGPIVERSVRDVVHADDWPHVQSAALTRAPDGHAPSTQARVRALDGTWRDVEFRVDDHRRDPFVRGYVLNGRDITAEVALEQQLGHARKLATLSDMAGRIAHAFNNALAALLTHAELLADELDADAPAREDVRAIRVAAERGAGITRQLVGFSGRHVIRPEPVRPAELVSTLRPTLQRLLPSSVQLAIESAADVASDAAAVVVDRAQFEQVLLNLVANARDAMPDGGTLTIAARRTGEFSAIDVIDSGVGMSDAVRARIFEPFYTTKPPGRGTGLGLAMVASIIKRAGGFIDVHSVPGRGTRVTVRLPLTDATAPTPDSRRTAATPLSTPAHAAPGLSGIVLLVDDDAPVRRATRRMLERAGYEVIEASDGASAIDVAAHADQRIDALVTDLMMPGLSGRDVIARVRVMRPALPIVCITGYAAERATDPSLTTEVVAIVAKPFSSSTLIAALSNAMQSALLPP